MNQESNLVADRFKEELIRHRLLALLLIHMSIFSLVFWCAYLMRFTLLVPDEYVAQFWQGLPIVVFLKMGIFYLLRSFHGWWRHVQFSDLVSLAKSSVVATSLIISLDYFFLNGQIPRTVLINDFAMTIVVIGGLRSFWRVWDERIAPLGRASLKNRALILGNGHSAAKMAHLINGQQNLGTRIVAMVSDNHNDQGRVFSDLKVVGDLTRLDSIISKYRAKTLFVIAGTLPAREMRKLLDSSVDGGFKIKILPPLEEQLRGSDKLPIREVSYNDLLKRKPINLDLGCIEKVVKGKTVLVTGAGGSIGSELCRQISKFKPDSLILLGRGENRIYQIDHELRDGSFNFEIISKIANITDESRMREVFATYRPDLVFHAAAHKHVPLVEHNAGESIINNVFGTKVVADLSHEFLVERFVLVSTDKAVNPTSVMGCTKQLAERYCQALGHQSDTLFISTRFGNVLGSAGSVVPLFQRQIQKGGPITITDERMTRYFMTIPEASQLVIQAASMGLGGEIFVLDMGEPVKILELAKDLIRLAGHPAGSIDIVVKGIRPGEKLYEELYYDNEESMPTQHDQILSSYSRDFSYTEVNFQVNELIDIAYSSPGRIRGVLKQFIPEFAYQKAPMKSLSKASKA